MQSIQEYLEFMKEKIIAIDEHKNTKFDKNCHEFDVLIIGIENIKLAL